MYTPDLLTIADCKNPHPALLPLPLTNITTPLNTSACRPHASALIPQVQYILDSIATALESVSNMTPLYPPHHPSVNDHPDAIKSSLQKEVSKSRLIGPLDPQQYPFVHISSLDAIPKKHSADKWRLILNLSHPEGRSINDGIDKHLCTLS